MAELVNALYNAKIKLTQAQVDKIFKKLDTKNDSIVKKIKLVIALKRNNRDLKLPNNWG